MKILLDSHALFWFLTADRQLSARARRILQDDDTVPCVSAVTAWEIANKVRLGKWPEASELVSTFMDVMEQSAIQRLPITIEHALAAGQLPGRHRDPFDRLLAAQSQIEGIPLVSADPVFRSMAVDVLW